MVKGLIHDGSQCGWCKRPLLGLYEAADIAVEQLDPLDVDFRDAVGLSGELMQYLVFSKDLLQTQKCHMDRQ